jgi:5-methylcytosine-specific restriction endonuclease McrA
MERLCRVCSASLLGRRSDVRYCSKACAVAELRKQQRRNYARRHGLPAQPACGVCAGPIVGRRRDAVVCLGCAVGVTKEGAARRLRRWRAENPEKTREQCRRQRVARPEPHRESVRRRRAQLLGQLCRQHAVCQVQGEVGLYEYVWALSDHRCYLCGHSLTRWSVEYDHVLALARGGLHCVDNIRPACGPCNRKKGPRAYDASVEVAA